ncbi:sugar transferase [Pseudaquidulcibacter saccharophilus]|uniref:sugar transferase n=1 Tax=Pseudaquidulcibacter saccharophilus TaxID=2831900 RepID=UPI001EFF2B44|nr:sugar transferase [Pseudaquidulcibacter saccharophilus]
MMEAVLRKRHNVNVADGERNQSQAGSNIYESNVELFTRACDIALSVAALVFLAPVLFTVALFVYLQDGGPIFYGQDRIGKNGKKFKCYKFRSMLVDSAERLEKLLATDAEAREEWERDHKLKNDPRITKFGNFIRKTSLDEFPQLWNVIKGEMSLVGPRPIVYNEIVKYGSSFRYYKSVKPGITGMWQVSGRNNIDYVRRVAIDRKFVQSKSAFLYLYIIFATVPAVLAQKGSY